MMERQLRQAADFWNTKPLKSDNIALGGIIPLPNGRKGMVVEEAERIGSKRVSIRESQ